MPYPHTKSDHKQPDTNKTKLIALWPVGQSGKASVGREVETPDGRKRLSKAALLEAIEALDLNETNGLELVLIKNMNRDDERFPEFTIFIAEARPRQNAGKGTPISAPRAAANNATEDDDIPF